MTTTIDSLRDGSWTRAGFFARFLGALQYFRLALLPFRHLSFLQRVAMSLSLVNVAGCNGIARVACIQGVHRLISIGMVTYGAVVFGIFSSAVITA